jgi:hypothetical protein
VAAVVSGAVLILHGGIGDGQWSLDQLRATQRPLSDDTLEDDDCNRILGNVLWSDPIDGDETAPLNRNTQVETARSCCVGVPLLFQLSGRKSLLPCLVM